VWTISLVVTSEHNIEEEGNIVIEKCEFTGIIKS
jgi:hypothetical protein